MKLNVLPKSHVELITYMNNHNLFYLMFAVVFATSYQLVGLGPDPLYPVTSLTLQQGEIIPDLYLRALRVHSFIILMRGETARINAISGT